LNLAELTRCDAPLAKIVATSSNDRGAGDEQPGMKPNPLRARPIPRSHRAQPGGRRRVPEVLRRTRDAAASGIVTDVLQAPNDKQQLQPMVSKIGALPDELGGPRTLPPVISARPMCWPAPQRRSIR
jgi:hypothetical protein